jgi:uncharacterized repeat protein (TIGR03809 family)
MSARLPAHAFQAVAQKWRALAERRRAHFLELYDSGRWKYYYNETEFLYRLREAIRLSDRWAEIAPPPADEMEPDRPSVSTDKARTAA